MSRIRSIHPGLFTDERYMALSFPARELIKGIWCEADDQGVFEWKPLTLKARIMPADAVNIADLLAELMEGEFVTRFEQSGKSYGAVRNFRKFQRPKKPNHTHLLPHEFRTYVGLSDDGTEPVPHQFPTEGEKPPQMEDEGRRMKEDTSPSGDVDDNARDKESSSGRGTRLAPDWRPSSEDWEFASHLGLDPEAAADEFRDYWCSLPGVKGRKLDWSATFRNRCRELAGRNRSNAGGKRGPDRQGSGGIAAALGRVSLTLRDQGFH